MKEKQLLRFDEEIAINEAERKALIEVRERLNSVDRELKVLIDRRNKRRRRSD